MHATFEAEDAFHGPSEVVASTEAYGLRILEIGAGQSPRMGDELQVLVSALLPLEVTGLVSAQLSGPAEDILELLATNHASACLLQTPQAPGSFKGLRECSSLALGWVSMLRCDLLHLHLRISAANIPSQQVYSAQPFVSFSTLLQLALLNRH